MRASLFLLLIFVAYPSSSQVYISSQIDEKELVCPGVQVPYQINLSTGLTLCSINWQVADGIGFFQDGNQTSPQAIITWDDQKPNKVEVQASVDYIDSEGSCTSPENAVVTFEHVLRSVFQETGVVFTEVGIIKVEPVHIYLQPKVFKALQPAPKVYI